MYLIKSSMVIIKIINGLGRRVDKYSEKFKRVNRYKNRIELKKMVSEIKK